MIALLLPGATVCAQTAPRNDPAPEVTFSLPAPPSEGLGLGRTGSTEPPAGNTDSSPASAAPAPIGPAPPDDPWAVEFNLQPDAVGLRWKPIPGALRYFVEISPDAALLRRLWMGTVEAPEARVPLHGFVPKGPVYVRLQAVNANAEEIAATVRPSLLGRQADLPGGISGITVTTQQAPPPPPAPPRRALLWQPPTLSRDLTLISGRFGRETYNNYLITHGLDWNADSPAAAVSTGARLLYTTNDRQGLSLRQGDMNFSTYLHVGLKKTPAHFSYNGYVTRQLRGGGSQNVHTFGTGYRVSPRLTTGAQYIPNPRYLTLWGSYAVASGNLLFQLLRSEFAQSVTLSYQSYNTLR
ncbi:MAG: hypothetical protein KY468_05565 [Armatimonadetes bacterium]|nr:hypothetical protein [Armatimonadota bacterium]